MSNPIEELAALRESNDVLLQQATGARARMRAVEGRDASGQVVATLDANGLLTSVRVGFAWESSLDPADLPAATIEAVSAARLVQLEQYGEGLREVEDQPAPRARPSDTELPLFAAFDEQVDARGGDRVDAARELTEQILRDARDGLEEANRLLDEHADRRFEARSSSGHVRASVLGNGELVAVDLDAGWLSHAHPANLGREITEAALAASQRARREGLAAALQATKLAQIARLATGPSTTGPSNSEESTR